MLLVSERTSRLPACYTIVDYRDNRHLGDSTIVKFTIAIYRDNRQYRASLTQREEAEAAANFLHS